MYDDRSSMLDKTSRAVVLVSSSMRVDVVQTAIPEIMVRLNPIAIWATGWTFTLTGALRSSIPEGLAAVNTRLAKTGSDIDFRNLGWAVRNGVCDITSHFVYTNLIEVTDNS